LVAAFQIAIATGAIGGGLLVDHIGALGGPIFAVITMTLGTLLALRYGPRTASVTDGDELASEQTAG
jgi:DHA1 family purine ribonucleoside efflux pump-like MFS transporter